MLEQLTNRNVPVKLFSSSVITETKDYARSRPFQHKLQHRVIDFEDCKVSYPSPSINYASTDYRVNALHFSSILEPLYGYLLSSILSRAFFMKSSIFQRNCRLYITNGFASERFFKILVFEKIFSP